MVNLLNKLSEIYGRGAKEKAVLYAQEALALSERLDFQLGTLLSYCSLAVAYFLKNDHPKSIEYLLLSSAKAATIL